MNYKLKERGEMLDAIWSRACVGGSAEPRSYICTCTLTPPVPESAQRAREFRLFVFSAAGVTKNKYVRPQKQKPARLRSSPDPRNQHDAFGESYYHVTGELNGSHCTCCVDCHVQRTTGRCTASRQKCRYNSLFAESAVVCLSEHGECVIATLRSRIM